MRAPVDGSKFNRWKSMEPNRMMVAKLKDILK
jgi:hypothetical protein